ncbi:MAG: hypothetical protein EHM88_05390, partial [Candidatus Rokuibacteriota bacterium]
MAHAHPADAGRAGAEGRGQGVDLRAPGHGREAAEDRPQTDGQHDHGELRLAEDPPEDHRVQRGAEEGNHRDGQRERRPVADVVPDDEHVAGEGSEHQKIALGEVHQLGRLVDEDEPQRDQAVDAPDGQAVEDQLQDDVQGSPSLAEECAVYRERGPRPSTRLQRRLQRSPDPPTPWRPSHRVQAHAADADGHRGQGRRGSVLASPAVSLDLFLGAARLAALVRARQVSPVELVQAYLDRIDRLDGRLHAYITVTGDGALDAARRAEAAGRSGGLGPLHGVPFAVKDQFATRGVRTTAGSRILADHVPDEDATVVARLVAAGGILLGKLNLTEFALGGTIHFPFGQPRNPWNTDHDTGGSSAGSAVAVAAALCAVSLGEDTGGSVRTPASWCGVAGHRPTWGLVSRHGCIPLSWSLDAPGPLGRTVEDCALVLGVIAGADARDALTARRPVPDYRSALTGDVRGLRVGVIRELTDGVETDPEVHDAVMAAAGVLGALGAKVEPVSVPLVTR